MTLSEDGVYVIWERAMSFTVLFNLLKYTDIYNLLLYKLYNNRFGCNVRVDVLNYFRGANVSHFV